MACAARLVAILLLNIAVPAAADAQPAAADEAAAAAAEAAAEAAADQACDTDRCDADDSALADDLSAPAADKAIDQPFGHAWLGAPDGDVTLVLFVDYACAGCREAQTIIDQLLASDSKLKVVYRILVNEDGGLDAAKASLIVARASADWGRFHRALDAAGTPTKRGIADAMKAVGVDPAKLAALDAPDQYDAELFDELSYNSRMIEAREAKFVPAWVIGDGKARDGLTLEALEADIAQARGQMHAAR